MALHGVHTCKSALCPYCAPKWQRHRSQEISQAIDRWPSGPDGVYFVTLTMRHNRGMALSLQHRLLTAAYGSLWSGNQGAKAALILGGKPESIRAHDRTWSKPHSWHPHVHSLLFSQNAGLDTGALAAVLDKRWPRVLQSSLKRFRSLCTRIVSRSDKLEYRDARDEHGVASGRGGCGRTDCTVCMAPFYGPRRWYPVAGPLAEADESYRLLAGDRLGAYRLPASEQQGECWHFRERLTRLFGVRLVPRTRKVATGLDAEGKTIWGVEHVALHDSALRLLHLLKPFTAESIRPTRAQGAFVERMGNRERLPNYLAKLGLELASSLDKAGKEDSRGVRHFGHWEVARLACSREHELYEPARKAWSQLFWATKGTQTITFSDRERLGLPEDAYAEGAEPPEQQQDETRETIGIIQVESFRARVEQRQHGVISELEQAYAAGELGTLGYVEPPPPWLAGRRLVMHPPVPLSAGPPATADPCALDCEGFLSERPDPGLRAKVPPLSVPSEDQVSAAGESRLGKAYRDATALPSSDSVLPEQLRRRLRERIG